jgi:hypothetical protein
MNLHSFSSFFLRDLFHIEAPPSVLAAKLIAMAFSSSEARAVPFLQLFSMDFGRDEFQKTGLAQRSTVIPWSPGNRGIFFPRLFAFNATNL